MHTKVVGGLITVPQLPATIAVADCQDVSGVRVVEVGGLLLGDLDAVDGSFFVEIDDVQVAQVLSFN